MNDYDVMEPGKVTERCDRRRGRCDRRMRRETGESGPRSYNGEGSSFRYPNVPPGGWWLATGSWLVAGS